MEHPFKTLLYDLFVAGFARLFRSLFGRKAIPSLQEGDRNKAA
jgi:hypothetical protein